MPKIFISKATASSSSSISFTSGLDSTYRMYEFHFINLHPSTNSVQFTFQVNASGNTGFNEPIMTTFFRSYMYENGTSYGVAYNYAYREIPVNSGYRDLSEEVAGSTGFDDSSLCGVFTLIDPSNTTYTTHFLSRVNFMDAVTGTVDAETAGYVNTASAIDEIDFKFSSGNIDAGTIKLYGVT